MRSTRFLEVLRRHVGAAVFKLFHEDSHQIRRTYSLPRSRPVSALGCGTLSEHSRRRRPMLCGRSPLYCGRFRSTAATSALLRSLPHHCARPLSAPLRPLYVGVRLCSEYVPQCTYRPPYSAVPRRVPTLFGRLPLGLDTYTIEALIKAPLKNNYDPPCLERKKLLRTLGAPCLERRL